MGDCGGDDPAGVLAAAVAEELHGGENEGEEAGGKAAQRQHQGEPAGVGVGALAAYPAEDGECGYRSENSDAKDRQAGAEEFSCVWLHKDRE